MCCMHGFRSVSQSVSRERSRTSHHWHQTIWPHLARASPLAVASCPATSGVQSCMPGASHQSLSGQVPAYLTDDINLVADSGRRLLRSAVDRTCVVPRTHNTYGDKSFTAAGPRVWNSLPSNLRDISYGQIKWKLKTVRAVTDHGALWLFCFLCPLEIPLLTYLYVSSGPGQLCLDWYRLRSKQTHQMM